jgi:hypothetical protein
VREERKMPSHASSIFVGDVSRVTQRRLLRREALCDFAGVAAGVGLGAIVWLAILSLVRIPL